MPQVIVNTDELRDGSANLESASESLASLAALLSYIPNSINETGFEGQFAPKVSALTGDAQSTSSALQKQLDDLSTELNYRADSMDEVTGAASQRMFNLGAFFADLWNKSPFMMLMGEISKLPKSALVGLLILGLINPGFALAAIAILPIIKFFGLDISWKGQVYDGEPGYKTLIEGAVLGSPLFVSLPVAWEKVTSINWYGNTQFAFDNRTAYYSQLQGFHSGLDFLCPLGTPIINAVNKPGTIISINNQPYNFKAGPGNVVVDYGDFLVLYGHTGGTALKIGDIVQPNDQIAISGTDGYLEHLHLEVIKKMPDWDNLPTDQQATTKPGNIRTNPVPYLSPETLQMMIDDNKDWDTFYKTPDGKWMTPNDQPDIVPGKDYFIL